MSLSFPLFHHVQHSMIRAEVIRDASNLCQSVAKFWLSYGTAALVVSESSIMKAILTTLCSIAAINFIGTDLRAEISDVEIHCIPKKWTPAGTKTPLRAASCGQKSGGPTMSRSKTRPSKISPDLK